MKKKSFYENGVKEKTTKQSGEGEPNQNKSLDHTLHSGARTSPKDFLRECFQARTTEVMRCTPLEIALTPHIFVLKKGVKKAVSWPLRRASPLHTERETPHE